MHLRITGIDPRPMVHAGFRTDQPATRQSLDLPSSGFMLFDGGNRIVSCVFHCDVESRPQLANGFGRPSIRCEAVNSGPSMTGHGRPEPVADGPFTDRRVTTLNCPLRRQLPSNQFANFPRTSIGTMEESIPCDTIMPLS